MKKGNRLYKDRLFRFIFNNKTKLLSLYNALNHSHYEDEDALEINTLEDFIYIGMKNDISFLLDSDMCLYEHQSTFNPNMPLRGFFYFSDLLQKYIADKKYDIYASSLVFLPCPRFVVFYNGDDSIPEQSVLKLSDAFIGKKAEKGSLEVEALMLDVNEGKNKELMESCRYLKDYAAFVGKVKEYRKDFKELNIAIDKAIKYCLEHGIMKDILEKHKGEVEKLIFREFDEAEYLRYQQKKQDDLRKEIQRERERAEQSEREARRERERAEQFRKILEKHGWSE